MTFDEFKNKYFESDDDAAMRCIAQESVTKKYFLTGSEEQLKSIVDTMEQVDKYINFLADELKRYPHVFQDIANDSMSLSALDMTLEKIESCTENPFLVPIIQKCVCVFLIAIFTVCIYLFISLDSVSGILVRLIAAGWTAYIVNDLVSYIWKYKGYKKIKKGLTKLNENSDKAFEKMDEDARQQYVKQFIDFNENSASVSESDEKKILRAGKLLLTMFSIAGGIMIALIALLFVSNAIKENLLFILSIVLLTVSVFVLPTIAIKITKSTPGYTGEQYKELREKAKSAKKDKRAE